MLIRCRFAARDATVEIARRDRLHCVVRSRSPDTAPAFVDAGAVVKAQRASLALAALGLDAPRCVPSRPGLRGLGDMRARSHPLRCGLRSLTPLRPALRAASSTRKPLYYLVESLFADHEGSADGGVRHARRLACHEYPAWELRDPRIEK